MLVSEFRSSKAGCISFVVDDDVAHRWGWIMHWLALTLRMQSQEGGFEMI